MKNIVKVIFWAISYIAIFTVCIALWVGTFYMFYKAVSYIYHGLFGQLTTEEIKDRQDKCQLAGGKYYVSDNMVTGNCIYE